MAVTSPTEKAIAATDDKSAGNTYHNQINPTPVPTVTVAVAIPTGEAVVPFVFGPPSLDEYIFFSDVIAIVRPISEKPRFLAVQRADGEIVYNPFIQSRFEVIEYLKGNGEAEITLGIGREFFSSSDEESLDFAETELEVQSLRLDSSESVVFLQTRQYPDHVVNRGALSEDKVYAFTAGHIARGVVGVALLSEYTTGLGFFPLVQDISSTRSFQSIGAASEAFTTSKASSIYIEPIVEGVELPIEFSIKDLRERIVAMKTLLREGEGIEGWEECIESRLLQENYLRTWEFPSVIDIDLSPSGLPAESVVDEFDITYPRQWFTGENAHLFHHGDYQITTTRPLPAGAYAVYAHFQEAEWMPCDYVPPPFIWRYNFEAAEDALHEAFFDPADIDDAVGADGYDGVLQPEWFETDDGEVLIERIEWQDGQVKIALSPAANLFGHRMDFIALDGSVALRLDFDEDIGFKDEDETSTFTWGVCEQPWEDGDLLMLRIASGNPTDGIQATNDLECLNAPTEQPLAPTAKPTATPEPTATSEPTSEPEPTPTPSP